MTAKEYLSEVNEYRRVLRSLELQIEEVRHQAEQVRAIVYDKDRVQTSADGAGLERYIIRLDELGSQYATNAIKYRAEITRREQMIDALANPVYAQILRLRYINGLKWKSIVAETNYSFRHATKLHGYALREFTAKYKEVLECPIT